MGLVLAFQSQPRPASRSTSSRRRAEPTTGASILFFTGVRYERRVDVGSAVSASRSLAVDLGQPTS